MDSIPESKMRELVLEEEGKEGKTTFLYGRWGWNSAKIDFSWSTLARMIDSTRNIFLSLYPDAFTDYDFVESGFLFFFFFSFFYP